MRKILVTGAAGFIGFHLSRRLLEGGDAVVGLDNLNPYYDVTLKQARLQILDEKENFRFVRVDLCGPSAEPLCGDKEIIRHPLGIYREYLANDKM